MMDTSMPRPGFPTTRWSQIARAAAGDDPDAHAALEELCKVYWYPIYAFVRRKGNDAELALDLTQDYFARLLEKRTVAAADQGKGRFRSFLLRDVSFFLSNRIDRDRAVKRGAGRPVWSIDAGDGESRFLREPWHELTPERLFDRAWALTLLSRAFDRLAVDYAASGRGELFDRLQGVLAAGSDAVPYALIAGQIGMSAVAVQQAASRLRKRYRQVLRDEIASTLDNPHDADITSEIRDLYAALSG
jgi:DNA-directed RNA polymerase specialized sigma24 family protein